MVNVDESFQVRFKKDGQTFEVLVDFNKLNEYKKDPINISVYDVLADSKIFKDQRKGDLASTNELSQVFNSDNEELILKQILLNGECQIPTAYINKLRDEKKSQVINYIAENAINPQTKTKYTNSVISDEVNKIKFNFDPNKDFISQANDVLNLLKKIMPIGILKSNILLKVPGMYCGNFYGPFRKYGKFTKEYFDDEGNLHLHIEVNDSIIDEVLNYIKNKSNNEAEYVVENN